MKLGVISDIHGDPLALELAWSHLQILGADRIVCAGDVVGQFEASFRSPRRQRLEVVGDDGVLTVEAPWRIDWGGPVTLARRAGGEVVPWLLDGGERCLGQLHRTSPTAVSTALATSSSAG